MALTHADPGTAIALRATAPVAGGPKAQALFKSEDLEVVRLAMAAGDVLQIPCAAWVQSLRTSRR